MRGLQSTLVLGATALCTANTQAAVVVNNFNRTITSYATRIFFSYDAVNQTIVEGGSGYGAFASFTQSKNLGVFGIGLNGNWDVISDANTYRLTNPLYGETYAAGASIGSAATWFKDTGYLSSGNYIGIRADQGNGDYNYGYAKYSVSDTSMTLESVAFETTVNTSITAIPEPSAALLGLAGGAAALLGIRRRKAA
jgi:hypothetical protein